MSDKSNATGKSLVELFTTIQCVCTIVQRLQSFRFLSALSQDPEYARRLEMLPAYKESLHLRYPPVCNTCLPAVEDEIRQKDHMARTTALGGWLQESKGRGKQRHVSDPRKEKENYDLEIIAWKIRGILWAINFSLALLVNSIGECSH